MAYWILTLVLLAGTASAKPSRIVGGQPTTVEKYPSIVQVDFRSPFGNTWSQNCGGSILTTRTILSAAHCFDGSNYGPHLRRIRAGATYRNTGGQVNYVLIAINHPTWDGSKSNEGDITVVRLMTPLVYSPVVKQTRIPPQGTLIPKSMPVVQAGWGITSEGGQLSPVLRDVTIFTVDHAVCADIYRKRPTGPVIISKNMICAGILGVGGKDACQADSGGPMYYDGITVGIVAFGEGCARADYPGVSTAVASYTNWISANTV